MSPPGPGSGAADTPPEGQGATTGAAGAVTETERRPDPGAQVAGSRRPLIERIGLFAIALVLAALFGGIAAALVAGGELFLGVMAGLGCAMTLWVGGLTLLRG
jgi:hypothetical protein